jgi:hypothetical protein
MRICISLAMAMVLLLPLGCANSTQLSTTWKDPSTTGPLLFKKVVVVVLNGTPGDRRTQEDALVSQIHRTVAIPSYALVSDPELTDRELVKKRIVESGADGAAVLRIVGAYNQVDYIPGSDSYWTNGTGYNVYRDPGRYVSTPMIRAEVDLYSVPDGKLLWAGSSTTSDPANAQDMAMQVAHAAAAELRAQGLLQ